MDAKTLCLCVLYLGEASGYEIKKRIEDGPFGQFHAASFGSIYPALNALCAEGRVSMRAEAQTSRPDKRVYRITPKGRHALLQAILEAPGPDRVRSEFYFILFFGELLPARHLDQLMKERVDTMKTMLNEMECVDATALGPGARFVLGMGKAIKRAQIDYLEANGHELVAAALRSGEGPAPAGEAEGDGDDSDRLTSAAE